MANKKLALPENVPGRFFVDETCINCDTCRDIAPTIFGEVRLKAFVAKQPEDAHEIELAELALTQCPKGSIGVCDQGSLNITKLLERFPLEIESGVFWLGYNSPKTFGGKSYFVQHPDGNWMIDSPKFNQKLIKAIEALGGLKYIFLTHRDDVGDADQFAAHFKASRIIHKLEAWAQPDSEIILDSFAPRHFGEDFLVIGTPGHTEGHCMLLYKNKFLFSGDTLTSNARFTEAIEATSPEYCWYSFDLMTASIEQLSRYEFEWLLPGHGRRNKLAPGTAPQSMRQAANRCREEKLKEPLTEHRLNAFQYFAGISQDPEQREYYTTKAAQIEAALARYHQDRK